MINENKSLPSEVDGLELNLNNEADNLESMAQDFSVLGTDPKTTKTTTPVNGTDPKTSTPTDTIGKDPLANIGTFMQGTMEGGREQNSKVDLSEYSKYFGGNIGYFTDLPTLDRARAERQGVFEQFINASGRVALNIVPEIVAQLANVVDFEDYFNSDEEVGNWLSDIIKQGQSNVNEALPIYRENPETALNVSDSGWWFENGASLVQSAGAFAATGYLTGGAALAGITRLGKGAKWLGTLGKASHLNNNQQAVARSTSALANAIFLNQAEGIGVGVDTFELAYERAVKDIKENPDSINLSEEDIDKQARDIAAKAATSAVNFIKLNILFNLTSAAMFLKTPLGTRNLLSPKSFKKSAYEVLSEGAQEYAEETINDISQEQALEEKYTFKDAVSHMLSAEGVESGLLGFIGGTAQTAMVKIGKRIPMQSNSVYQKAYTAAYNKTSENLSSEERHNIASKEALAVAGTDKKLVSDNYLYSKRYAEQQEQLLAYEQLSATDKATDITSAFHTAEQNVKLLEEIKSAQEKGDNALASRLQDMLLDNQILRAFELGTTQQLINTFEGYSKLSPEEALAKGLDESVDYKVKATEAVERIKSLENLYLKNQRFINSQEAYDIDKHIMDIDKHIMDIDAYTSELDEAMRPLVDDIMQNVKKDLDDTINLITDDGSYDLDRVPEAIKNTRSYQDLKVLSDVKLEQVELRDTLKNTYNVITSNAVQERLTELIKKNREAKQKEYRDSIAKATKDTIRTTKNKVAEVFKQKNVEEEVEVNTATTSPVEGNVEEGVETVVESDTEVPVVTTPNKNLPKIINVVDFPVFVDGQLNNNLNTIKKVIENPNIYLEDSLPYLEQQLDVYTTNQEIFSTTYPLEAEKLNIVIDKLSNSINALKSDLLVATTNRGILSNLQQELIDDLSEEVETQTSNAITDESPANQPDLAKLRDRVNKFIDILGKMSELGIDISNFKEVVSSFEQGTSKDEVIKVFNLLKGLYNAANNANIEGSYEEIMYDRPRRNSVIESNAEVMYYNKDTDTYDETVDDISADVLETYKGLAQLNNIEVAGKGFDFEIHNVTGSDKLAYLARQYNIAFTPKISPTGNEYIEVTKEDINNLLNIAVDQRVLDPDILTAGTEIEFVPLTSVTLEDGTVRTREESSIDDAPIGIKVDGELLEGIYLHDVRWLNRSNLDNNPAGIEADQNKLRNFRALILNSPTPVKSRVVYRGPGVPILDATGQLHTLASSMPGVQLAISKGGQYYTGIETTVDLVNPYSIKEGKTVAVIPYGDKLLGLPIKRTRLSDNIRKSITGAISMYLEGKATEATKELQNIYGINILSQQGLEDYLSNFLHLTNYKFNTKEEFDYTLNSISDVVPAIQFQKGVLYYGFGQGIQKNTISKDKNTGNDRQQDLNHLDTFLKDNYINIDLAKLDNKTKSIPFIIDNKISKGYDTYESYVKENTLSPYLSITLENGKTIYTIQSSIRFDMDMTTNNTEVQQANKIPQPDGIITKEDFNIFIDTGVVSNTILNNIALKVKNNINLSQEELLIFNDKVSEINEKLKELKKLEDTKQSSTTPQFTKPNGDVISFDNITDFSPIVENNSEVQYALKAVSILQTDKAIYTFEKGTKHNWSLDKILTELQVPKEQKQLILNSGKTNLDDIITELLVNYSYTVEINTGEATIEKVEEVQTTVSKYYSPSEDRYYRYTDELGWISSDKDNKNQEHDVTTPEDLEPFEYNSEYLTVTEQVKSNYYDNLTVPGGTNYTENEIATPAITPSIKGHAQFATNNGIGWFRSDEEYITSKDYPSSFNDENGKWFKEDNIWKYLDSDGSLYERGDLDDTDIYAIYDNQYGVKGYIQKGTNTKTRRILEIQSDLFQKGRKDEILTPSADIPYNNVQIEDIVDRYISGEIISEEEKEIASNFINNINTKNPKNQFLQLLNKDNNWVTFFIKSIIQDSAKKGYEKVLFPSGNTAAKVEGHQTLEEFKKQKEDRIKSLQEAVIVQQDKEVWNEELGVNEIFPYIVKFNDRGTKFELPYKTKEEAQKLIDSKETEINQLKQELERIEKEGFGALKPIYNFYENTVTNILNKTYGKENVKVITDEYGNTWNEVDVSKYYDTVVDLSPITSNENQDINADELLRTSSLITGVSVGTQQSLIKSISYDVFKDLLDNKDNTDYNVLLRPNISLHIQGLETVVEAAKSINHPQADFIENQVKLIKDNIGVIYSGVKAELSKKINVNALEDLDNPNNSNQEEDADAVERNYYLDTLQYTIDPRTTLTNGVKQFLDGIVDVKKSVYTNPETGKQEERFVPVKNILQLYKYIPYDVVYNDLLTIFAKSNSNPQRITKGASLNTKYGKLKDYEVHFAGLIDETVSTKPYLKAVLDKFINSPEHIRNGIITALNKTHTNHIYLQSTYNTTEKSYHIRSNKAARRGVHQIVLSEWQNNIGNVNILETTNKGIYLNEDKVAEFFDIYETLKSGVGYEYNKVSNWLGMIGVELPLDVFQVIMAKGIRNGDTVHTFSDSLRLSNGLFKNIADRVKEFKNGEVVGISLDEVSLFDDNSFKQLAKIIGYFRPNIFNNSFKNYNGDTIYGWTASRYATDRALALKSDVNLLADLTTDPFAKSSLWLNSLYPPVGENVVRDINKNSLVYKTLEYATSDSLKVKENVIGKTIDSLDASGLAEYHLGNFYNNGASLVNKTIPVMKVVYPTMSDKANTFVFTVPGRYFRLINGGLSETDKDFLVDTLIAPEVHRILFYQANKESIDIAEYAKGGGMFLLFPELNNIEALWENDELKEDVLDKEETRSLIRQFLMNALNSELNTTLNKWQEADILEVPNNTNKLSAPRLKYIDKKYQNTFKPSSHTEVAVNYILNTAIANMNFQQLFIGDPALYFKKDPIETAINQGKRLALDNAGKSQFISDPNETFNLLVIADNEKDSRLYEQFKKFIGKEAEAYKLINTADAQEYTTLEEHLNLMFKEGKVSKDAVDEIMATYKRTGKVDIKKYGSILNPFKPVYGNNFKRNGIQSRLYIKSSSIPLIKEFTQGTPLDTLRELMEKENIQRVAYKSAVKVGLPKNLPNIYNEDGTITIPDNWKSGLITNIPRNGHGNQQEVPYDESKKVVNDGTQRSKLLFTNLLDVGGFVSPKTGKVVTGRELSNEYLDAYNNLFKLQYDKLIKSLNYHKGTIGNIKKLKKILVDEGIARNYNKNDIASLELNELATKFATPLWLNNADSKITALLSSIVDNRIRKRKFRGKSFVLASNTGTELVSLDSVNKNGIIKAGDWDGTLKERVDDKGNITYAEIIIPFKFWDNSGKLLKAKDFVKEDGTLDLEKVPESLLEFYGYRIPTSGVNLIATIKVVGFLPESYGDIVIAPSEFIVQMGSDFDVDKLYTQMYHTHYDSIDKTLVPITEDILARYKSVAKEIARLRSIRKEVVEQGKAFKKNDISGGMYTSVEQVDQDINDLTSTDLMQLQDIESAIYQNEILDIHKAVLNAPIKEVQYARARPLGFGRLPEIAKKYFSTDVSKYFSPLFNNYQQDKYLSARAGKAAVGIFSLDMVFNSSLQYVTDKLHFTIKDKEGNTINKRFNLFGINSVALNDTKTSTGRYKSEVIEGYMQAALDNEKEQLLGKLNINNNTFDFIRAATLLGFEEDIVIGMINQPIIKEYFKPNSKIRPINTSSESRSLLRSLTIDDLYSGLNTTNLESDVQLAILASFLEISTHGKELKSVQSAINSDSSGVGKNLFYSLDKVRQLAKLPVTTSIPNIEKVIGDFVVETDTRPAKVLLSEGYLPFAGMYVKPTSINGFASLYATALNVEMWRNFYPLGELDTIAEELVILSGEDIESVEKLAEIKQDSLQLYKQYLISDTYKIFSNYSSDVQARKDLLFDTETHMSLGSIVQDIKNKKLVDNVLLSKLQIGSASALVDKSGRVPTQLSYVNALTLDTDEDIIIADFIDMIVNNKEIGTYNGEVLTTRGLIDKLITHQVLTSGVQKSGQFIKFIPYNYLKQKGYYTMLESKHQEFVSNIENLLPQLIEQYVRHNPSEFENKDIVQSFIKSQDVYNIVLSEELPKNYIIEANNSGGFNIYKKVSNLVYNRIDTAGFKGITEYSFEGTSDSVIYINQRPRLNNEVEFIPDGDSVSEFLNEDKGAVDNSPLIYNVGGINISEKYKLSDNSLSVVEKYRFILSEIKDNNNNPIVRHFAQVLFDNIDYLSYAPLYIDTKLKAQGRAETSPLLYEPMKIRINPNLIGSDEEFQNVVIEEVLHAVLKAELNNNTNTPIHKIFNEVKKVVLDKYGVDAIDNVIAKVKSRSPLREGVERNVIYNVTNIDEFVAASIKDKQFQEFLNNIPTTTSAKSLWHQFIDAIKNLLVKLGVKTDSNLASVLHEVVNKFDKINKELYKEYTVPTYVKSVDYIVDKFNLADSSNRPLFKGNATEIADFINRHIVNLEAKAEDGFVTVESKTAKDFIIDNSPMFESVSSGIGENLVTYIQSLELRVKQLRGAVKKARVDENIERLAYLEEQLELETDKFNKVKEIRDLVSLADKGKQELENVKNILKRPLTSEDMVYLQGVLNFWKDAKQQIFSPKHYESEALVSLYGGIEALAKTQSDKLFLIQKEYMQGIAKKMLGREVELDEVFENYKDINFLQQKVRDISTYDNELLSTIWIATKQANINALDETNKLLDGWDKDIDAVLPILKAQGQKEIFNVFRQKSVNGLLTNHLVNPFNSSFYKERHKIINPLRSANDKGNFTKYLNWLNINTHKLDLAGIFPPTGEVTPEVEKARQDLRNKVGKGTYDFWFKNQERKIKNYEKHKESYIHKLINEYNLDTVEELNTNSEALGKFNFWVNRNSPYKLVEQAYSGGKLAAKENYNSYKYYEALPIKDVHYDNDFKVIENNDTLYRFYTRVNDILEELKQYVPESQLETLAYNGIPAIEKTLFELFNEKGMELGFAPVMDMFYKSMQTSYTSNAVSSVDPVTGQPTKEMRIPIIKSNSEDISKYIDDATIKFIIENKKEPSATDLERFREEAIDEVAKKHSFDLGKIIKVYASLVYAYKHKHKLEDTIKIANTILSSYKETRTRPDGTPLVDATTGVLQRKDEASSFVGMKSALNSYVNNIFYGDVKEEEGKGKKILTKTEKRKKAEILSTIDKVQAQIDSKEISKEAGALLLGQLKQQELSLGASFVPSKFGDNILKYFQLKLMGWNVLGGISNMGFGWIANFIEASDGRLFNTKDLNYAYSLVTTSILKNGIFNQVELDMAKKIRNGMNKWDVLKDASQELYSSSTPGSLAKSSKWLAPYNIYQYTEYINQAPLLIALARNAKITTDKGEISIWDGFDKDWNWNTEYGAEPKEEIAKLRIKLDQVIKRTHGNYDNMSPLEAKRVFLGRAVSQFRTWMYESVAVRFEKERFDDALGLDVKGRYRSIIPFIKSGNFFQLALEALKALLKNYTFGYVDKSKDFNDLVDGENFKEVDAANMRKVIKEVSLVININLALLALSALKGDDDESKVANLLFNQGARLRTDLLLYANPSEARNIVKDIIPAMGIIKDTVDWSKSVGTLLFGEDEIQSGVHAGDSRFIKYTMKMLPFGSKIYSIYNSSTQVYDK